MRNVKSQEMQMALAEMRQARRAAEMQPGCSAALVRAAGKLGRSPMPEPEPNDDSLTDGARRKMPLRYE